MKEIDNRSLTDRKIKESNVNVSVYAYDYSLVTDLRARFKDTTEHKQLNETVQITSPERAFDIIGTLNKDTAILPFVSLERTDWQLNLDRQGYQTFVGDRVVRRLGPDNLPVDIRAQVIPITINWRLSVWTKDRLTNDALVRELLWYYHLHPSLLVRIGHGLNIVHKFNIFFNSDIEDNSDIANHVNNGTYFRQDLTLYSNDAYLWHANYQPLVEIVPGLRFSYEESEYTMNDTLKN